MGQGGRKIDGKESLKGFATEVQIEEEIENKGTLFYYLGSSKSVCLRLLSSTVQSLVKLKG